MIIFRRDPDDTIIGVYRPGWVYLGINSIRGHIAGESDFNAYYVDPEERHDLNAVYKRFIGIMEDIDEDY